jgi:hypothetical protein
VLNDFLSGVHAEIALRQAFEKVSKATPKLGRKEANARDLLIFRNGVEAVIIDAAVQVVGGKEVNAP